MRILHMLHSLDCKVGEIGVTARNGSKWSDALGQIIALCVCTHRQTDTYTCPEEDIQGHGKVISVWRGSFSAIPARLIEHEHELESRGYSGLLHSMRRAYGEAFSENNDVVVLTYERID